MNRIIALLTQVYSVLLYLYPSRFRAEFAEEMQLVFERALKQAMTRGTRAAIVFCLRELRDLPKNALQEHGRMIMIPHEETRKGTPREVIATLLPFAIYGFFNWLYHVSFPDMYGKTVAPIEPFLILMAGYFVLLIGFGIGCIRGFPRWSYGYLGLVITINLAWLGAPAQWIPFISTILIALVLARSLRLIKQFFVGIWNDWTRASLALFGFLTWFALLYDEVHHPYLNAFFLASAIIMTAGAGAFEWIGGTWQRIAMLLLTLPALGALNTILWSTGAYYSMPPSAVTSEPVRNVLQAIVSITFFTAILYSPGVVGLARRISKSMRST